MTVAITPDVTADDSQAQAAAGQAGGQVDSVVQPTASQPAKPAAATADQIESTCKGASAEFVLAQLKAGATIEAAKDAWIGELAQQLAARPKENKPAAHSPGVAPVGGTAAAGSAAAGNAAGGDAIAMWNEAIADKMKAGMNKQRATRAVIAENAELHTEYLRAYNELHGRKKAAALL